MNTTKKIDHKVRVLDIIASKIGLRYAKVEERQDINGDTMEYAIMGDGYLTSTDIQFLEQQGFRITGIYATNKNELLILVEEFDTDPYGYNKTGYDKDGNKLPEQ